MSWKKHWKHIPEEFYDMQGYKKDFPVITAAKAIGILLVIIGHCSFTTDSPQWYQDTHTVIYLFHMPLFMSLSGFLFYNSFSHTGSLDIKKFLRKKFLRLIVPYLFISFTIAGVIALTGQFIPVRRTVDLKYLCEIFCMNVGGSAVFLWFLYALFIQFLLMAFSIVLCKKYHLYATALLAVALFFLQDKMPGIFYLNSVAANFIYFWAGTAIAAVRPQTNAFPLPAAILFLLVPLFSRNGLGYIAALTGIAATLLLSWIICRKKKTPSSIEILGKESPYIYLLHMGAIYPIRILLEYSGWINSTAGYLTGLVFALFFGTVLPVGIHKYIIRKSPVLQFLMGDIKK